MREFTWQKRGNIFNPEDFFRHPQLLTHAANPLPIHLHHNTYRIFYNGRCKNNRSSIGAVDIDIISQSIEHYHKEPFFSCGKQGSFYENGLSIGCHYQVATKHYLLFMGWKVLTNNQWVGEIGRLLITDDKLLVLDSTEPLLGLNPIDPISLSYPCINTNGTNDFTMWYGSTHTRNAGNGEMLHVIHQAHSNDGILWKPKGQKIPYIMGTAQVFSRPTIWIDTKRHIHHMWFSYRGAQNPHYRIGHAFCENTSSENTWNLDLNGSTPTLSSSGWDSQMIAYPYVLQHHDKLYMLYNGNDYGKTGFGLAYADIEH